MGKDTGEKFVTKRAIQAFTLGKIKYEKGNKVSVPADKMEDLEEAGLVETSKKKIRGF